MYIIVSEGISLLIHVITYNNQRFEVNSWWDLLYKQGLAKRDLIWGMDNYSHPSVFCGM